VLERAEVMGLPARARRAGMSSLSSAACTFRCGRPANSAITIVHDYEGVGSWMKGKWKANEPVVKAIVDVCKQLEADKRLDLSFQGRRAIPPHGLGDTISHASMRERMPWQQLVALRNSAHSACRDW
jgi:hypothetical protein